jgi:hypothetical protein
VDAGETELNPIRTGEGQIKPVITISEGPLALVGAITFTGNTSVSESELRAVVQSQPDVPYFEPTVAADEDSLLLHYYNLGFAAANVGVAPHRREDGTRVDLEFTIGEGPRILVDHVIIVGNRRTDPEVIRRELRLRPGEPLGLADRMESQRRLGALGLFRRVSVQPLSHGEDERQDLLVTVEEAPATSTGYGGGFEISRLLRPGPSGDAEQRFEFAPRGFFEFGRRNLGGKNRSINVFTRFGLRPDDSIDDQAGPVWVPITAWSNLSAAPVPRANDARRSRRRSAGRAIELQLCAQGRDRRDEPAPRTRPPRGGSLLVRHNEDVRQGNRRGRSVANRPPVSTGAVVVVFRSDLTRHA